MQHSVLDKHVAATVGVVVDFPAIPHTEHACSSSGEENLPFNGKKPSTEPEPGSAPAAICRDGPGLWEEQRCKNKQKSWFRRTF